jgi:hypothetical protein
MKDEEETPMEGLAGAEVTTFGTYHIAPQCTVVKKEPPMIEYRHTTEIPGIN